MNTLVKSFKDLMVDEEVKILHRGATSPPMKQLAKSPPNLGATGGACSVGPAGDTLRCVGYFSCINYVRTGQILGDLLLLKCS